MSRIILAFDASLLRTGVCLLKDDAIKETGVIETYSQWGRPRQLDHIYSMVGVWTRGAPDIVAIETSKGWQRASNDSRESIDALAMARAAIMLAIERETAGIRIVEMDSHRVRELVAGNRSAGKEQVQAALTARGYTLPTIERRVKVGGHMEQKFTKLGMLVNVRVGGKYEVQTVVDPDVADSVALGYAVWSEQRLLAMQEGK